MTGQQVHDESRGKYFHQMLNMADDDLNPYEYRLLGHYIRVAAKSGRCWESVRTTGQITHMSAGMVVKTRNRLEELKYIRVTHRADDTCVIAITDRMAENIARYVHDVNTDEEPDVPSGKRSYHEQRVHAMNSLKHEGVHQVKQRRIRTKEEEKDSTASDEARSVRDSSSSVKAAPRKRSPKQQANDEASAMLVRGLGDAWGVTAVGPDEKDYLIIARRLVAGTVPLSEFKWYVQYQTREAKENGYTIQTVWGLVAKSRISNYVKARDAYRADQEAGKVKGQWTGGAEASVSYHKPFTPVVSASPSLTQQERIALLDSLKTGSAS